MKFNTKRIAVILIVVIIIVITLFYFISTKNKSNNNTSNNTVQNQNSNNNQNKAKIVAVGDMLPHDAINKQALQPDGSYSYIDMFSEVKESLLNTDATFCNQEVPSAGSIAPISGYPVFNAPDQFAKDLYSVGCNVVNLANNHMFDKGQNGINNTRSIWDNLNVKAIAGANRNISEQEEVKYFTINGIKFAFLSYAEYSNIPTAEVYSLNIYNADKAKAQVTEASNNSDVVLVSMHWGTEYSNSENEIQKTIANNLANSGADVIIGTGPHVLQPVEQINNNNEHQTLVWYSLGNFLSAQLELPSLIGGMAQMEFVKDGSNTKLENFSFLPTYMHYEWTQAQKDANALLERKNFKVYPLENAQDPLSRSLFNTTVDSQIQYVKDVLSKYTTVKIN